jgi:TonB-dependent SusC/RagA subfamily outer membrane receptor
MIARTCCAILPLAVAVACARPTQGGQAALTDTTRADGAAADSTPVAAAPAAPVTSEDINRRPAEPVENLLMARFPGVEVARSTDGRLIIRIRGSTSILGSNEPLYVVDGIPVPTGPGGGLSGINPHEIASIEVLKDPASTAMYGVRGANGVILIKTKRPDQ